MRVCDLVLGVPVNAGLALRDWEAWGYTDLPPSVLLEVSLQPGARGSQQVLITKVGRTPSTWNKLFTVFKGEMGSSQVV